MTNFDIHNTNDHLRIVLPHTDDPDTDWRHWWIAGLDQTFGVGRWDDPHTVLFVFEDSWDELHDDMHEYDENHPYPCPD